MPTNYPGNGTATEAPAAAPSSGVAPTVVIPLDGEAGNAASVTQAFKVLADYIAYIQSKISLGPPPIGDTPQARFYDTAGNLRSLIDHNGYPMGRRSEFREEWVNIIGSVTATATPIIPMQRWSATVTGTGGTLTVQPPLAGYTSNFARIFTNAGAGTFSVYTAAPLVHTANTFLSTVIEWEGGASNSFGAATHSETAWMGLTDNPAAPASSTNYCWFTTTAGQSNWQCANANGGVISTADSGVANSAFTAPGQRFRIELHGSASPYAGKARFFINETVVKETTTNLPATAALSFVFGTSAAASSSAITLLVGPALATWNRQLSLASL